MQPDIRSFILVVISVSSSSLTLNCACVLVVVRMFVKTRIFGVCKLLLYKPKNSKLRYQHQLVRIARKMQSNVRWMMMCAASSSVRHLHFLESELKAKLIIAFFFRTRYEFGKVKLSCWFRFEDWKYFSGDDAFCSQLIFYTFVAIWMLITLARFSFCQTCYAREFDFIEESSSIKRLWMCASHMRWFLFAVGHSVCFRNSGVT